MAKVAKKQVKKKVAKAVKPGSNGKPKKANASDKRELGVQELAKELGLYHGTIRGWITKGKIKYRRNEMGKLLIPMSTFVRPAAKAGEE